MKFKILILFSIIYMIFGICAFADEVAVSNDRELANYFSNIPITYSKEDQKVISNTPTIGCKAVYIAEANTGKVIYEKNAHVKMYPASTTKILTALVVLEKCQLTEKTIVSKRAVGLVPEGYSNAKLQVGEELDVETLLYALLLPSSNEAANALAEHVSGSIEEFAKLCNERAKELGCENLHFVNPNGIHDENHYCTAYDLYLIAKECRKHDVFNRIVKTKSFILPSTNVYPKRDREFNNTNELLLQGKYYYSNCTGIKTGFTTPAGECLIASSSFNNLEFISVVLGGKSQNSKGLNERFYDTRQLFDFGYENYSIKDIANYGDVVETLRVGKATKETAQLDVISDADISTILPKDINKNDIRTDIVLYSKIEAPLVQDQILGHIDYYADGLVYRAQLIASHPVEKVNYKLYYSIIFGVLLMTFLILVTLLRKKKKLRRLIAILGILVIIGEGVGVFYIYKELEETSMTVHFGDTTISFQN